jgi:hypothetical protein
MQYILNNTLLALLEFPDATLLGVLRMFAEPAYRKKIVDNLNDPVVKAFWQNEFAKYTQKLETEALASIQNKVGQLVSNPLVRNIFGQPRSSLNMRDIMDSGKILIVNLSKGKIGEDNSSLLGAMMITRIQLAAMSRVDIPENKRRDFFLHVDEFQNFATESFANILSEARKYRLSLTIAHQYIGQLVGAERSTQVRDAVFGNVGTIITFRVGAEDAEFLEKEFMPEFLQNDLVNLARANIYIKLMIDGVASRPFSAETLPKQRLPLVSYRDVIIKNSQEHYGTPRKVVEERIASEWQSGSDAILQEKIDRRDEKRLSEVLRPDSRTGPINRRENRPASSIQSNQPTQPTKPATPMDAQNAGNKTGNTTQFPARTPRIPSTPMSHMTSPAAIDVPRPNQSKPILPPEEFFIDPIADDATDILNEPNSNVSAIAEPQEMIGPPAQRVPKHTPKPNVDISELRKAISESLKKQATEGGTARVSEVVPKPQTAPIAAKPATPVAHAVPSKPTAQAQVSIQAPIAQQVRQAERPKAARIIPPPIRPRQEAARSQPGSLRSKPAAPTAPIKEPIAKPSQPVNTAELRAAMDEVLKKNN